MKTPKNTTTIQSSSETEQSQRAGSFERSSNFFRPNPTMEKLAAEVAEQFSATCHKLRELKPKIDKIQKYFQQNVRGSVQLAGCGSFSEFCVKCLHRSQQAVYQMLSSDGEKRKKKKPDFKLPTTEPKPVLASVEVEQLRAACFAASRYFEADDKGDKEEAKTAKAEFLAITNAASFKPLISGDVPNHLSITLDLLSEICKLNVKTTLPMPLMRIVGATRKRLGLDDESFGILTNKAALSSASIKQPALSAMAGQS
jgi:hypothetical protein